MANLVNIQNELNNKTNDIRSAFKLPNIAAVIVNNHGNTVLHSVKGIRNTSLPSADLNNQMGAGDYFNVGSISKPITGFFMACLIKKNILKWETRIRDVFPEVNSLAFRQRCGLNENFLNATVAQLLDHTCGMNGYYYFDENVKDTAAFDPDPFRFITDQGTGAGGNSRDPEWKNYEVLIYLRYLYAILCMKQDKYLYNSTTDLKYKNKAGFGYGSTCTICTSMAEKLMNKPWEKIINEIMLNHAPMQWIFGNLPNNVQLHMYNAANGKFVANLGANNPFAPWHSKFMTGAMHCTVHGMAQYIKYNMPAMNYTGVFNVNDYLKAPGNYAQGGLQRVGSGNNVAYWHNGGAGSSYAEVSIYPTLGYGFSVMTNSGGGPAGAKAENAAQQLMQKLKTIIQNWENY